MKGYYFKQYSQKIDFSLTKNDEKIGRELFLLMSEGKHLSSL